MTTKVFVGNLDFQTTDQALADAFVDCGRVKSGVIITRGRRSLGYGFVEFESAEAADKAVETKNGTELSKRQIKVELVRDPAERPARGTKEGQGATDQKQDVEKGDGQDQTGKRRGGRRTGGRGGGGSGGGGGGFGGGNKRRFARRGSPPQGRENSNPSSSTQGNNTKGVGNNPNPAPSNQSKDRDQNQKPKRRTRRRNNNRDNNQPQNPPKEKILSKTAIFVANIPFEAKDEDLKNFFKDSNPKSAHVVTTQTGRSRGYGFVDFDNEKDQQHAIQNNNKAKWTTPEKEPREISVSASHSQPKDETVQSKE